jgi:Ni/Co efflux regulator RcnB
MKIKIIGGLLVAALAITSMAQAQTSTPHINRVQHRQEHRIAMDVRHGKISRRDAHSLRTDEHKFNNEKRMAMADGRVTRGERRHLRRDEKKINHQIRRDERKDRLS